MAISEAEELTQHKSKTADRGLRLHRFVHRFYHHYGPSM